MDLDEIRTFVTIARERSFSAAATKLGRSQPAISRRIELLESELGEKLFERLRAGALLTDAGSVLLPYAEAMLANAKDGAASVRELQAGEATYPVPHSPYSALMSPAEHERVANARIER